MEDSDIGRSPPGRHRRTSRRQTCCEAAYTVRSLHGEGWGMFYRGLPEAVSTCFDLSWSWSKLYIYYYIIYIYAANKKLALSLPFSPVFAKMSLAFGANHLEASWSGPEYRPGTWIPLDPLTWLLKIHIKITTLNRSISCKWCKWAIFHSYVSLPEVYIYITRSVLLAS